MKKTLMTSNLEIYSLLERTFKEDIVIEPISLIFGRIEGKYKGEPFNITFKRDNYLLLSTSEKGSHLLTENNEEFNVAIRKLFSDAVMEDMPICSYNTKLNSELNMFTLEWDIVNGEERIKDIINGRSFQDKPEIYNIILFNNKSIEDYLETKEEKEEIVKNAKIYGIYPGAIKDTKKYETISELDLYFQIDGYGKAIFSNKHAISHGHVDDEDISKVEKGIEEMQYALEYLVYQTTRFGVELNAPEIDKHISATESYYKWLRFYSNHFDSLSDTEWDKFMELRKKNDDYSAYLPKGNWKDGTDKKLSKSL